MMSEVQAECHQQCEACTVGGEPGEEHVEAIVLGRVKEQCLKEQNLSDLAAIQAVIAAEMGEDLSTQQVLRRVLGFYNKYVPFMQ